MPIESRTVAAMRGGDEFIGWSADRYLLASLVDAVRENTFVLASAHSDKKKPKPPEPIPRPKDKSKEAKTNPFAAMAAQRINAVREARRNRQ
ncbi:hypothetical protein IL38_07050 [Actinopolyspora erythraea]|uniref:Tail assembly chaperone n=1 Tax=Actinopolyspora erythraea TaxID=414996 RepID=A0ABR4X5R8_9ACTN|nr:hypothetical protein IL38_07050 [Actinopolyspora erythraea]